LNSNYKKKEDGKNLDEKLPFPVRVAKIIILGGGGEGQWEAGICVAANEIFMPV
jgi:hypothetical protein